MTKLRRIQTPEAARSSQGFTMIEAMVVLVAFGFIMAVAFGIFTQLSRVAVQNDQVARSQAGARVAIDEIERSLRSAGAEIDLAAGQQSFVWAEPYQLAFNANLLPGVDPNGTGSPGALLVGAGNAGVPSDGAALYTAPFSYSTGAETTLFTLDSNRDAVVSATDKADDPEEASENPNDYVLYKSIHGSENGANTIDLQPVAVVRGPEPADANDFVPPLFVYWLDDDDNRGTPPVLHGDADGDGELSAAETAAVTPVAARDLVRIERVGVNVTSETAVAEEDRDEHAGYERVSLSTEIKIRQVPRSTGVIYGVVFRDIDGDGIQDADESPLEDVTIQSSSGMQTTSAADGRYMLIVTPGQITVTEIDPNGYVSSTPNTFSVDAYPGSYTQINFGDTPNTGTGSVRGLVYFDENEDGVFTKGERGIANVKIFSDTGEYGYTGANGGYILDVPIGVRTISEVDSTGYVSTTPNSVEVVLTAGAPTGTANFGDTQREQSGTVDGYVYQDDNRNGMRDAGESGIQGAIVVVNGAGFGESDTQGYFSITVPTGSHTVFEQDPPGYSSTTPNILLDVLVETDKITTVYFGDIVQDDVAFDVIELSDTEKALSIASGDLREDIKGDPDIVLGTRFSGGVNNILVWHNNRKNFKTPNAAIFGTTASYTRPSPADVTSLIASDLDGDSDVDVISGLASDRHDDLNIWMVSKGSMGGSPSANYNTESGEIVTEIDFKDMNNDGLKDMIVAVDEVGSSGQVEILVGTGGDNFEKGRAAKIDGMADGYYSPLNAVLSVQAADIDGDGLKDIVLANQDSPLQSSIHVYLQDTRGIHVDWVPLQNFRVAGQISQIRLVDLVEDNAGDMDLVIATVTSELAGKVEVWHQGTDGFFGIASGTGRIPDDTMTTGGAPLSMMVTHLDNDVFPDVLVGVRRNSSYEGTLEYALGFGHLISESQPITTWSIGAVLTMTMSDFNMDGVNDVAVGTQSSSTRGKILVFFRK